MEYWFHMGGRRPRIFAPGIVVTLPFALNHMTAPTLGWEHFLDLARGLGCAGWSSAMT